jgi:hypothetical protein
MRAIAVHDEPAGVAVDLDPIVLRGGERHEYVRRGSAGELEAQCRRVVLGTVRAHVRGDAHDLLTREPPDQIHVVRGEVEQRAAAGRAHAAPGIGAPIVRSEGREDGAKGDEAADRAGAEMQTRRLEQRVRAIVEARHPDAARAPPRVEHAPRVGQRRGDRLLEVEVLSAIEHRHGEIGVRCGRRGDDDRVHVGIAEQRLGRLEHARAGRERLRRRASGGVRIGERGDANAGQRAEHGKMHGTRDLAAAHDREGERRRGAHGRSARLT